MENWCIGVPYEKADLIRILKENGFKKKSLFSNVYLSRGVRVEISSIVQCERSGKFYRLYFVDIEGKDNFDYREIKEKFSEYYQ